MKNFLLFVGLPLFFLIVYFVLALAMHLHWFEVGALALGVHSFQAGQVTPPTRREQMLAALEYIEEDPVRQAVCAQSDCEFEIDGEYIDGERIVKELER